MLTRNAPPACSQYVTAGFAAEGRTCFALTYAPGASLAPVVMRVQVRKNGTVPWVRPDGKTQVTCEYRKEGGAMIPVRVHTILISTQHSPDVTNDQIHADLMEHVIKPVVPAKYLDDKTIFHLNPSGAAPCAVLPALRRTT